MNSKKIEHLKKIKELLEEIYPNLNISIQSTLNWETDEMEPDCLSISPKVQDNYGYDYNYNCSMVFPVRDDWGEPCIIVDIDSGED